MGLRSGYRCCYCRGPWIRGFGLVGRGGFPRMWGFGEGGSWLRCSGLCGRSLGGGGVGPRGIWDLAVTFVRFMKTGWGKGERRVPTLWIEAKGMDVAVCI